MVSVTAPTLPSAAGGGGEVASSKEMAAAHALQRAVATRPDGNGHAAYERFVKLVSDRPPTYPRDLLAMRPAGPPVPLNEVEPATAILRRFSTGAMAHGSLSAEAPETIAIAMNPLGGKSDTREGGQDPARHRTQRLPLDRNSPIRQRAAA